MSRLCSKFLLVCLVALLSGCTAGRNAFNAAEKHENEGRYDEAVMGYAEAIASNPELYEYRLRFLKASEKGAEQHLARGQEYLQKNNLDEALREFQSAAALDPSMEMASQLASRTQRMRDAEMFRREGEAFEKENKPKEAFRSYQRAILTNPDDSLAKDAVQRLLGARKTKLDGYDLSLKSQEPITLKFKEAKLKDVFAIVTQLSGINFIFDEGIKEQNVTIHLEKATFNQAVDVLTGMFRLGRKVLNDSTVILYPKTPDKLKNYEELVVKTFYLNRLDAKKAVNLLRTMLQLKKIYVNEENNALVIRDTPDTIAVAERIIDANDVPDAEVLLEVEIIELAKKNQEKFGLALSRYAISANLANATADGDVFLSDTLSSVKTASDTPTTVPTAITNLLKIDLGSRNAYYTVPNATFNFGKTLANGETLSNPKLRVKNREKAKFNVGTRVPITTTSTTGTTSGYSVNVQYVDVGVKMNAEPTIQLNNEISLKVGLEVSSIINKESVGTEGATTVVTIGTRNLDTVLNLKDGETTIIGGLMQDIKSKSKDKISFLGDIPVIGTLFTNHSDSNDKTELILAITPRLIKGITVPEGDVTHFWSGRDDEPSTESPYVSFVEEPQFDAANGADAKGKNKNSAAGDKRQVGSQPPTAAPPQDIAPPPGEGKLSIAGPDSVKSGQLIKLTVFASEAQNLHSAPFVLHFDPAVVDFVSAEVGTLMALDKQSVVVTSDVNKKEGTVAIVMTRPVGSAGVSGDGSLAMLTFKATGNGLANFDFSSTSFADPSGKPLAFTVDGFTMNIE